MQKVQMFAFCLAVGILLACGAGTQVRAQKTLGAGDMAPLTPMQAGMQQAADYSRDSQGQAVVVMRAGKVIFERYDNGGSTQNLQMLASGSKSFVGLTAMAAVADGILDLDHPACESLTEWKNDPVKSRITYRHLLSLTSGLTPGERGMAVRAPAWKAIAAMPMTGQPGAQFEYGAYQINTFAYALERLLKNETFEQYLARRVLAPLGAQVQWRFRCDDGHPQVGGGAFTTARDWAKVGELVRLGGNWNGKQLIPSELLAQCFKGSEYNTAYGLTWWLKHPVTPSMVSKIPLLRSEWGAIANAPWLPDDLVAACGAGKQRLYVIPSLQLVIVRQGQLSQNFSDLNFLSLLLRNQPDLTQAGAGQTRRTRPNFGAGRNLRRRLR